MTDTENQERIAQVRARLDATKGDPSKPWWLWDKSRAREELTANAPTDLAFLLSRVDSLESALREAQKDVERLDWLSDERPKMQSTYDGQNFGVRIGVDSGMAYFKSSVREAIDAARADTGEST